LDPRPDLAVRGGLDRFPGGLRLSFARQRRRRVPRGDVRIDGGSSRPLDRDRGLSGPATPKACRRAPDTGLPPGRDCGAHHDLCGYPRRADSCWAVINRPLVWVCRSWVGICPGLISCPRTSSEYRSSRSSRRQDSSFSVTLRHEQVRDCLRSPCCRIRQSGLCRASSGLLHKGSIEDTTRSIRVFRASRLPFRVNPAADSTPSRPVVPGIPSTRSSGRSDAGWVVLMIGPQASI
jgi:hypothetical protein